MKIKLIIERENETITFKGTGKKEVDVLASVITNYIDGLTNGNKVWRRITYNKLFKKVDKTMHESKKFI